MRLMDTPVGLCACLLTRNYLAQCGQRDSEKNKLEPHLKKQWCVGATTAEYLSRMEDLLHLYHLPLDEKRPVVCFDELPVRLTDSV